MIVLGNGNLRLGFDGRTGALVSLLNLATGDEYLKQAGPDGGLFRILMGQTQPYTYKADPANLGGTSVTPRDCRLLGRQFTTDFQGGLLRLTLESPAGLRIELSVRMPHDDVTADCGITVTNEGPEATTALTTFPHLGGLQLGEDAGTNLAVHLTHWGWSGEGAGVPAWDWSGGIYGGTLSTAVMQWGGVWEPSLDEGLGLIIMDPETREKFIWRGPNPGRMWVLYIPEEALEPGQTRSYPPARLLVHRGNWQVTATRYRDWFRRNFRVRRPPSWLDEVDMSGFATLPVPEHVHAAIAGDKEAPPRDPRRIALAQQVRTFRDLPRALVDPVNEGFDHFELWAYYTQVVKSGNIHPGYTLSDALFVPRPDLGGAAALRRAVDTAHRLGRRVTLYMCVPWVDGFAESNVVDEVGRRWTVMGPGGTISRYKYRDGLMACPGSREVQEHFAQVCKRLLWETGADGLRLDTFGTMSYTPCYNPEHHHPSPFGWNQWIRTFLRRVR